MTSHDKISAQKKKKKMKKIINKCTFNGPKSEYKIYNGNNTYIYWFRQAIMIVPSSLIFFQIRSVAIIV